MSNKLNSLSEDEYLCDGCDEKRKLITTKTREGYLCQRCYDAYMEYVLDD